MFEVVTTHFKIMLNYLFEPSPVVIQSDARRNARLLSVILFVVTLGTLSGAVFTPEELTLVRTLMQLILLPLFLLYLFSRTSWFVAAAGLTIPLLMLTPYMSLANLPVYNQSVIAETIMWLLLPMSVAVIVLPLTLTIGFLLLNITMLGSLPFWVEGLKPEYLANGLSFVIILSALLVVIAAIRKKDIDELHSRSEELQQQKQWLEYEINERRLVETEVVNLQSVINGVNEAVLLVSARGIIERVNDTSSKMFGYKADEFVGHNISVLAYDSRVDEEEPLLHRFLKDEVGYKSNWFRFKARDSQEHVFFAEAYASLIRLNGVKSFVLTVRDVSEHKRIEALKDEFVSSVSHELRTPLTSIQGAIALVNGIYASELSDKVRRLVSIAYENSTTLCSLVDDILNISKLESEQMQVEYEQLNITDLIKELLQNSSPLATKHSIEFQLVTRLADIYVDTDKKRFTQVMRNLLSNAAKHSPVGDVVEVDYEVENGQLRISVTDHGEGIPQELQSRIFEKFFQVEATSKQARSGTGLGLSISKSIVEQMHGKIWLESQPGDTRFYVELPIINLRGA